VGHGGVGTEGENAMGTRRLGLSVAVGALWCGVAQAADWDHDANIDAAVTALAAAYREGGLEQAEAAVGACYPLVETHPDVDARLRQLEYCAGMDFAASKVDFDASRETGRTRAPFFHPDRMIERMAPLLVYVRDTNVQNQILRAWSASALESLERRRF
jgi:hypothetical protein